MAPGAGGGHGGTNCCPEITHHMVKAGGQLDQGRLIELNN